MTGAFNCVEGFAVQITYGEIAYAKLSHDGFLLGL